LGSSGLAREDQSMRKTIPRIAAIIMAAVGLLGLAAPSQAEEITNLDGVIGRLSIEVTLGGGPGAIDNIVRLTLEEAFVTQHNNMLLPTPLPTTFSTVTRTILSVTPLSSSAFLYEVAGPDGLMTISPMAAQGGGQAMFSVGASSYFVLDGDFLSFLLTEGPGMLLSNSTMFDYSPFLNGGGRGISFQQAPASDLNGIFAGGGTITGSASFSQSADAGVVGGPVVPEPSTFVLALIGLSTLAGVSWYRCRGRSSTAVRTP